MQMRWIHHLGRQVVQSATVGLSFISLMCKVRPAEVCQFELILPADEDILWLHITMDDPVTMYILQCLRNLRHIPGSSALIESFFRCFQ